MKIRVCNCLLLSFFLFFLGCSLNYQKDGKMGVLGFVWIEYRLNDSCEEKNLLEVGKQTVDQIAPVVQQKSLGVYIDVSKVSSGVGVGYRDLIIVVPENDSKVDLDYFTDHPFRSKYIVEKE